MTTPTTEDEKARKEYNVSKPMWKALSIVSLLPINLQGKVSAAMQLLEMETRAEYLSKLQALKEKYQKELERARNSMRLGVGRLENELKAKLEVIEEMMG